MSRYYLSVYYALPPVSYISLSVYQELRITLLRQLFVKERRDLRLFCAPHAAHTAFLQREAAVRELILILIDGAAPRKYHILPYYSTYNACKQGSGVCGFFLARARHACHRGPDLKPLRNSPSFKTGTCPNRNAGKSVPKSGW
jgi:hypothetical protein